jgi:hypothetical protein
VWGGPNSPWLLLDAVAAAEVPEGFVVSPDGGCLLYVSEGLVKAVRTGDLSEVQAAVALKFREHGSLALTEPAVSIHDHPAAGRVVALGRSGRLYGYRRDRETVLFEALSGETEPTAAGENGHERPREITIGTTAVETGLAAALPAGANTVFVCRGRDAVRTSLEPWVIAEVDRPLRIESLPPSDYLPGRLFRYLPKPTAEGRVHRDVIAGPEGMTFNTQTGALTWEPPATAAEAVRVVLHFKDRTGRSGFQSFVLLRPPAAGAPVRGR